jgi:hypothetical protein
VKRSLGVWTLAAAGVVALAAGCTSSHPAAAPTASASAPASPAPASSAPAAASPNASSAPGGSPTASAAAPGSAAALVAASLAALKAGTAVHVDISTTVANGGITYSDDAAAGSGRQDITLPGGGAVMIVYVAGVGYVKGNAQGLAELMGLSSSQAQTLAGEWIAVHPGESLGTSSYADIVAGITLSSVASEITPAGPLTLNGQPTIAGQRAIAVLGRVPASQQLPASARLTFDVAADGSRPLRETVVASGYTSTTTFSDWGESLSLSAPAHSVAPAASPPALD